MIHFPEFSDNINKYQVDMSLNKGVLTMINEANFKQVLFDYAYEKYGKRFKEFHDTFYDEFPYKYEGLPEDIYIKNLAWFKIKVTKHLKK